MLTKFKLVKTEGLKGLMVKGRFIPFDRIDDTMAEQLIGKTHVLERLPGTESATTSEALALPEATDEKKNVE
jgi:hypothetical protein